MDVRIRPMTMDDLPALQELPGFRRACRGGKAAHSQAPGMHKPEAGIQHTET